MTGNFSNKISEFPKTCSRKNNFLSKDTFSKSTWSLLANSLGFNEFSYEITQPIYDDHRAFYLETGIPSIDIIDFDYPYWHTINDIPENCSAKTLKIIGNLMCEYIFKKNYENK